MDDLLSNEDTTPPTDEEWAGFMAAVRAIGEQTESERTAAPAATDEGAQAA